MPRGGSSSQCRPPGGRSGSARAQTLRQSPSVGACSGWVVVVALVGGEHVLPACCRTGSRCHCIEQLNEQLIDYRESAQFWSGFSVGFISYLLVSKSIIIKLGFYSMSIIGIMLLISAALIRCSYQLISLL